MSSARALLLSFLLPLALAAQSQSPAKQALKAARLIDGKTDTAVSNVVVVVESGKITAIGHEVPPGATVIDLGDATLLPGLIDAHTHLLDEINGADLDRQDVAMLTEVATQSTAERALRGVRLAREELEAGVTTVRDLGNSGVNGDVALRDAIRRGWIVGPRIIAATRALAAPGGQFGRLIPEAQKIIEQEYVTIAGAESARQAVRQALYDGADCIKVIVNGSPADVTLEEMKAIVVAAHASHVKVAAHAIGNSATRTAAEAGVDSIEHAYTVPDDVLKMMAQKHIFLVPTDVTLPNILDMAFGGGSHTAEERSAFEKQVKPYVEGSADRLRRAIKFGVPIAFGSDMYLTMPGKTRGQASLQAFSAYAETGLTPMQIIRAATSSAAELLGLQDQLGALESGKEADIIAVPGDPLRDYRLLQQAKFVMKGGAIVKDLR